MTNNETYNNIYGNKNNLLDFMLKMLTKLWLIGTISYEDSKMAELYAEFFDCVFLEAICEFTFDNPQFTIDGIIREIKYDEYSFFEIVEKN